MAKYQPYPAYKSSGVEWLGDVPSDWRLTELKRYVSVKGGFAFPSDSFTDQGVPVIRIGDIKFDGSISLSNCKRINAPIISYKNYIVSSGKYLMAMTGATIGKVGVYSGGENVFINQRVGMYESSVDIEYRYLWYILASSGYQEHIKLTAFGGAQPNISDVGMLAYKSTLPSKAEQQKISAFLDYETAQMDNLVAKQEKLIELLKEKRQAVISHAVTKGLNPNAEMKDSGVEWLGQIPKHWDVPKIKQIVSTPVTDGPHETPTFVDEGVPFISAEAVSKGFINFQKIRGFITEELNKIYSRKYSPQLHDIYMVKSGATTGVTAIVETEDVFNIWSPLAVIRCKEAYNPYFVLNFMRSYSFQEAVELNWSFGTQQNIGMGVIENLSVPCPPLNEAKEIALYLKNQTAKIDKTIEKAEQAIELLKERRTALISAAVTGKIDVRSWQQPSRARN